MKKQAVGALVWLFMLVISVQAASARCDYYVGDTIRVPIARSSLKLDNNISDKKLLYLYGTYTIGNYTNGPVKMETQTYPYATYKFTTAGRVKYTAVIYYTNLIWKPNLHWVMNKSGINKIVSKAYTICDRPVAKKYLWWLR